MDMGPYNDERLGSNTFQSCILAACNCPQHTSDKTADCNECYIRSSDAEATVYATQGNISRYSFLNEIQAKLIKATNCLKV